VIRVTVELLPSTNRERKTLRVMDISNAGTVFTVDVTGERDMHRHKGLVQRSSMEFVPVWKLIERAIIALKLDKEPL
jgi:hypothetical protein